MLENAQKDYLTGLHLRDSFYPALKRIVIGTGIKKGIFCLAIIDLDDFKKCNDRYGHPIGDDILKHVANLLCMFFNKELCFRFGGDEFVIIIADKNEEEAVAIASEFRTRLALSPYVCGSKPPLRVKFSCGIAAFPSDGADEEMLIRKADEAMYFSKRRGHNVITPASKMRYISLRNMSFIAACIGCAIVGLFLLYQFFFKQYIETVVNTVRSVRIVAAPGVQPPDTITLKNGGVLKGTISRETETNIMLDVHLKNGSGTFVLRKSEIASIKRSSRR